MVRSQGTWVAFRSWKEQDVDSLETAEKKLSPADTDFFPERIHVRLAIYETISGSRKTRSGWAQE